jgi:hypothetical protein
MHSFSKKIPNIKWMVNPPTLSTSCAFTRTIPFLDEILTNYRNPDDTHTLEMETWKSFGTLWGDFPSLYSQFYKVIMHGSTNATNEGRIQM